MRYLNRQIPCKRLQQKSKNPPENELSAKRAWRRFKKKDTRKACYKLQQGLCAYTELSLDSETLGYHLEHIAPRSQYPERTFAANNLVLSTLSDAYAGCLDETDRFAGHFKKSNYSDDWFVSPYQKNCEKHFDYCAHSGQVLPSNHLDEKERVNAERTIEVLNLNCDYLLERRRTALSELTRQIHALLEEHVVSDTQKMEKEILIQLFNMTLQPENKALPEFYTAKKQLLTQYIKRLVKT